MPNIASSAAQAGYVQAEAARTRDASQAGASQAARRTAQSIDEAGNIISTDDNDTQVYTDSEGTGGKGRESGEEPAGGEHHSEKDSGVVAGHDGETHIDIQA